MPNSPTFVDGGLSRVGDMGALPTELPFFALPQVPFNLETLRIVFPVSLALALVGVGLFPLPAAEHLPVAVTFFVAFTVALLCYGTGDVLAGLIGAAPGTVMALMTKVSSEPWALPHFLMILRTIGSVPTLPWGRDRRGADRRRARQRTTTHEEPP